MTTPTQGPAAAASPGVHPSTAALLDFFAFEHLPYPLARISARFHDLAHSLVDLGLDGPELIVALRKLLEGKDAAVRAALTAPSEVPSTSTRETTTVVRALTEDEITAVVDVVLPALDLAPNGTGSFELRAGGPGDVRLIAEVLA